MNNKSILMSIVVLLITMSSLSQVTGTYTDTRDSKTYKTIIVAGERWMAENLAYKAGSGCWAYNNDPRNVTTYGYLYNWETANKVCPTGWHLPHKGTWGNLIISLGGMFLGPLKMNGGKLKEIDTIHWRSPNTEAVNKIGFTALPGGLRYSDGTFQDMGNQGNWWSSDTLIFYSTDENGIMIKNKGAYIYRLSYDSKGITEIIHSINNGCSIRCVRDSTYTIRF